MVYYGDHKISEIEYRPRIIINVDDLDERYDVQNILFSITDAVEKILGSRYHNIEDGLELHRVITESGSAIGPGIHIGALRDDPRASRSIKSRSVRPQTPDCPVCGSRTSVADMKTNGYDGDRNLYEVYKCPSCGSRFSVTFTGASEWWYDEGSIESPSKKRKTRGMRR
ncbi:MAG: hypothetical protein E7Z63_01050 [Thermoplasmata archaeon]|nr:hypothetical protein [Thermoplasmata archaeon]